VAIRRTSWPKSLDTLYGGCEFFSQRVAEITDNRFQIQPFAGGELVPGLQVLDAVANGTVEIGNTALYYYWSKNPAFTFGTAAVRAQHAAAYLVAVVRRRPGMLNDLLREYNCHGIPTGSTGAQMGGWFRKEIKSSEDLKGLKFRVGGFAGTIIAKSRRAEQMQRVDIIRRWRGHHRCRRMWSALMTTRSWVSEGGKVLLRSGLVGRNRRDTTSSISRSGMLLPKHYQAGGHHASHDTFYLVTGKYDYVNPPALSGARRRCDPETIPQEVLETCIMRRRDLCGPAKSNPHSADVLQPVSLPQRIPGMDCRCRTELRQLHDANANANLMPCASMNRKSPEILRGFFSIRASF